MPKWLAWQSLVAGVVLIALLPALADAHETLPGVLELHEQPDASYVLRWRQPVASEGLVLAAPVFPGDCRLEGTVGGRIESDAPAARGRLRCSQSLAGREVSIAGWRGGSPAVLVRLHHVDGRDEDHLLRPASPTARLGGVASSVGLLKSFFFLGVGHILSGVDHLLFVAGLFLIVGWSMRLAGTVTAFTAAHSLTLAAATLGWVSPPIPPIEVAIALSILFLAPEALRAQRLESSFTVRSPWWVAFAFGLLHGFGFAGALTTTGTPAGNVPLALLAFNVGVEAGQLAFVLALVLVARAVRTLRVDWPQGIQVVPAYVVGTCGAFWTLERSLALVLGGP